MEKTRGRHRKEIDRHLFEELCKFQCTLEEICEAIDCDHKTLYAWCEREYAKNFSQVYREKRQGGKLSLRRAQFVKAVNDKNPALLIFLGKNWLGQSDNPQKNFSVDNLDKGGYDLSKLSVEELFTLNGILGKIEIKSEDEATEEEGYRSVSSEYQL